MQRPPLLLAWLLAARCYGLRLQEALVRQDPEGQADQGGSEDDLPNPFKNVILVVHCRQPSLQSRHAEKICEERRPLFDGYQKHFGQVIYLTQKECTLHPSDSHKCLVDVIEKQGAERDGVFYMNFDAMLSARRMRATFDKEMLNAFGDDRRCSLNDNMRLRNCEWEHWVPGRAERYRQAMAKITREHKELRMARANQYVYLGNDDLFYIPHKLYRLYKNLTHPFIQHGVHHEITGPTVRKLMEKVTTVLDVNLKCGGGCCQRLDPAVVLAPDFQCGHSSDLKSKTAQDPVDETVNLNRQSEEDESDDGPPDLGQLAKVMAALTE